MPVGYNSADCPLHGACEIAWHSCQVEGHILPTVYYDSVPLYKRRVYIYLVVFIYLVVMKKQWDQSTIGTAVANVAAGF